MKNIENIDDLISKYLSGNAEPEEAILLEDWKKESAENLKYFIQCHKVFGITYIDSAENKNKALNQILQSITTEAKTIPLKSKQTFYLRIAASFLLLIGLGVLANYFLNHNSPKEIVFQAQNTVQNVKLNDGTEIAISENSGLSVDKNYGLSNRLVKLNGNAHFKVIHQEELPFTVKVKDFFIRDIGTAFSVRLSLDTDSIFVNVDEGVVLLFDSLGSVLEIKASQKAIYIRSKRQLQEIKTSSASSSPLSFNNSSLAEVIAKVSELYSAKIDFENAEIRNCKITTAFTNEDLNTVLTIITETLGLSFEKTKDGYLIKGQKCQL